MDGIFLMLCADLVFALMAAATKFTGARLPASEIVVVRSVLSCITLYFVLRTNKISLEAKEPGLLWARGVVGYIALQSYFWALPQLTLGTAVMLNYTAPIFAIIFSFYALGERPPLAVKLSLLALSAGIYLLCSGDFSGHPVAVAAGLLSGILAGSVYVMIRRGHKTDSPLLIIFYFSVCCALGSTILLLRTGCIAPTFSEWLGLLAISAASLLGQVFLTYSLRKSPVWAVAPFGYLTPVLSLVLGVFFWGETPSAANLLGGAMVILCGIVLVKKYGRV